ncbi:MAG TPA: hypothetical protein VM487_22615 [Phycisphaerae bacterium]|nr:hypothetical protein [Phycisphaerae bacterium]
MEATRLARNVTAVLAFVMGLTGIPQAFGDEPRGEWSGVGAGLSDAGLALTVFDDGSGEALYAAGAFIEAGGNTVNCVAKWDGTEWSDLNGGVTAATQAFISALAVFNDGTGDALYACGYFDEAGGVPVSHIAKWNGAEWSALGSGLSGGFAQGFALAVFDDGNGRALYAGGFFTHAGGIPANSIAKWDGQQWSALAGGLGGSPPQANVLAASDADSDLGAALWVGGVFQSAGGVEAYNIAKWDGSEWSALGDGVDSDVYGLTIFDDASGDALYVAGEFTTAGDVDAVGVAKWDGSEWSSIGGLWFEPDVEPGVGYALTVFDDGTGPALYVSGVFAMAADVEAVSIAKWDGGEWWALGDGITFEGEPGEPYAVTAGGTWTSPAALYASGDFDAAGGVSVDFIAAWTPAIPGDLNGDGCVDQADLGILLADWGCSGGECPGDCDGDGDTDQSDLGILLTHWGEGCP